MQARAPPGPRAGAPVKTTIDFDGLSARLALPSRARRTIVGLAAGKSGELFLLEGPTILDPDSDEPAARPGAQVRPRERETATRCSEKVERASSSPPTARRCSGSPARPGRSTATGDGAGGRRRAEETKRSTSRRCGPSSIRAPSGARCSTRPGGSSATSSTTPAHGLDLAAAEQLYLALPRRPRPIAPTSTTSSRRCWASSCSATSSSAAATCPKAPEVGTGLLGADYEIDRGRYRFARVFDGESWNPKLRAPLTQPGVDVRAGEYLLAVEGSEVRPPASVYSFFEQTADRAVRLRVGPDPERRRGARGHRGSGRRASATCATAPGSRTTAAPSTG